MTKHCRYHPLNLHFHWQGHFVMLANFALRFRIDYFAEILIQWQICVNYFTTFDQNILPDITILTRCHQIISPDLITRLTSGFLLRAEYIKNSITRLTSGWSSFCSVRARLRPTTATSSDAPTDHHLCQCNTGQCYNFTCVTLLSHYCYMCAACTNCSNVTLLSHHFYIFHL